MLLNLTKVLQNARVNHYAVPAFDCTEDLMIRPILDTCEELGSPMIMMALDNDLLRFVPLLPEIGITEDAIQDMLVNNPARVFFFIQ